jgi:hypothetical protein
MHWNYTSHGLNDDNENADQMPHQMRGIGHGRMDTLKFLPAGNNWKRVQVDANEVFPLIYFSNYNQVPIWRSLDEI